MLPNPKPSGGRAPRPDVAIVLCPDVRDDELSWRRVGPPGIMSGLFHLALLALFGLIAPSGQSAVPVEYREEAVIEMADDQDARPTFQSEDVDPLGRDDGIRSYDSPIRGEVAIPGLADPNATPGLIDGTENVTPASLPPPPGFDDGFAGGALASMDRGGASLPGGGDWRRTERPKGGIGAASMSPQQYTKDGGSPAAQAAVAKGLGWLARVQSPDGRWKLDGPFPDKGNANDVAGTALGMLPFLAAGKTHKANKDNPYDKPIERAVRYLIAVQNKRTGAFSRDMYAHGLATIAITEAFSLSQDYSLKKSAQMGIHYIVKTQHDAGGWRYSPGQAGDTSVSGWQIMALKSGLMAGLDVPVVTLRKAQSFLDHVVDPATEGSGYLDTKATPTMTAVALLCRQYLNGWGPRNLRFLKGVDHHLKPHSPRPSKKDVYFYYYATQVMHQMGGEDWKTWNFAMRDQLTQSQEMDRSDPTRWGSWSPAGDRWGSTGGRLMVTSLNLLTLEVYYRYLPLYSRAASKP